MSSSRTRLFRGLDDDEEAGPGPGLVVEKPNHVFSAPLLAGVLLTPLCPQTTRTLWIFLSHTVSGQVWQTRAEGGEANVNFDTGEEPLRGSSRLRDGCLRRALIHSRLAHVPFLTRLCSHHISG